MRRIDHQSDAIDDWIRSVYPISVKNMPKYDTVLAYFSKNQTVKDSITALKQRSASLAAASTSVGFTIHLHETAAWLALLCLAIGFIGWKNDELAERTLQKAQIESLQMRTALRRARLAHILPSPHDEDKPVNEDL
jgi:hypothetical protein